ncbi:PfkB family carbohydrate kinase [Demequina sp. NBRC 110056]|uniref:PfkB family carbohydrate kinase n=1 Tax=Demequina sp. NBRC 110056 TaxID=1570345 RepID=UPI000A0580C8|nr:PfkB family carbohydrate kinase [Demequina sp. NBRC 110056]
MPHPAQPRALFAGLCTLDVIQSVERLPSPNEKVAALDFLTAAGGPATNAAVAFAHIGGSAALATRLPEHPLADPIRADLAACGVELHDLGGVDGPPVTASILVTRATGDRAVVSPSASALSPNGGAPVVPPPLGDARAVLVDGYHPDLAVALAREARAASVPVLMDAGSLKPHTGVVAGEVDIVVASDDLTTPDGAGEPEAVFAWLAELGATTAVITRGARPLLWRTPAASGEVSVAPVRVVDTLGAGDFLHGALTFRVASLGRDDARLAEDLAWASAVVAPSLGSFGTRAWLQD